MNKAVIESNFSILKFNDRNIRINLLKSKMRTLIQQKMNDNKSSIIKL